MNRRPAPTAPAPGRRGPYPLFGVGLLLGSAVLYGFTLAPTVLWGDDAMFQWALATGRLTNHPLWGVLARLFAQLPVGDLAFRANLASAVYAVGAVGFLFLATLALAGRVRAAVAAGAVLAISHTFWLQSVRAEVYTLHMLLFFGGLWACIRWRQDKGVWWLLLALAFWGVGTVNHLLLSVALPGGLWLILSALAPPARKRALLMAPLAALTAGLLLFFLEPTFLTEVVPDTARVVLATFGLSWSRLLMHLTVLVYQFPLFGLLALPGFLHLWRSERAVAVSLGLMAVPTAVFASTHSILESYVFYLPVFGLIALVVGIGFERVSRAWARGRWLVVTLVLLTLQVGLYRLTPLVVERLAPGIIPSRDLPGRRASVFFLWPSKHGYVGARQFATDTLERMPPDAMLIADWTIFAPLRYLQDVEGQRQDVWVVGVDPLGMQAIRENNGRRPLFLANADPRYYPLDELNERFVLRPVGTILTLELRQNGPRTESKMEQKP